MERYEKLYEEKSFGFQRLMKAFPDMKSRDNNETLEKFKIHFNIKKKDENKKIRHPNATYTADRERKNGMIRTIQTDEITKISKKCVYRQIIICPRIWMRQ